MAGAWHHLFSRRETAATGDASAAVVRRAGEGKAQTTSNKGAAEQEPAAAK
jgi:hypothetical protein